jgi:signal transduction histidine kinase
VGALELTNMPITGATGAVLKRSLGAMQKLIDKTIDEVRSAPQPTVVRERFLITDFLADAGETAMMDPKAHLCRFEVVPSDPALCVEGSRGILSAAMGNLLQNAFKFTQPGGAVQLRAVQDGNRVLIQVQDSCGGLPAGSTSRMFTPFSQRSDDRTGLGLGLSIARKSVEADGGTLSVQDIPGLGCVFTMSLELASACPVPLTAEV